MSKETERRVGNLLNSSQGKAPVNDSDVASNQGAKQSLPNAKVANTVSTSESDLEKEIFSVQLKERQEKLKVNIPVWPSHGMACCCYVCPI